MEKKCETITLKEGRRKLLSDMEKMVSSKKKTEIIRSKAEGAHRFEVTH